MKKIIFSAMLLFSVVAYSQESEPVVLYKPYQADGFLVLNKNYDSSIDHWTIEYSIKNIDENGVITYTTIEKASVYNQNYITVSKANYEENEVYGTIVGLTESNAEIVTEGPILLGIPDFPINTFNPIRYWTCNGTYYAYEIVQLENQTGQSKLRIDRAYNDITTAYMPYYQYTTSAGFDALVDYHDVHSAYVIDGLHTVNLSGTVNTYYTASGNPIMGNVFAVAKSEGPWQGVGIVDLDNEFNFDPNVVGSFTLEYMIDYYNQHGGIAALASEGLPPLECNGVISGLPGGAVADAAPCSESSNFILGVDGDINDFLDFLDDECMSVTYEEMQVEIEPLDGGGGTGGVVVRPFGTSKFDANGAIISNPITIGAGLHRIAVETIDGKYYSFVKEVNETFVNTLEMADFLTATVFPVPITGEQFSINFVADAKLKFEYILSDLDGNELYSQNFVLEKDHNRNHIIEPMGDVNFPTGILINTIIFQDGSILSFETIKN